MRKLILLLLSCFFIAACSDETFSTDPSYSLQFSEQEVAFDTLITTTSSRTRTVIIYNRQKEGIRIPRIALGKGASSPFRINVDGQYLNGGVGRDFEVLGQDSIFMRIEFCAAITPGQDMEEVSDEVLFTLESGISQRLPLRAGVMDAELVRGLVIERDTLLQSIRPLVIFDSLKVDSDATLTIAAGTTLMFHHDAGLTVDGRLVIQGTLEHPVVLRSDQTEHMFENLYYDNTPGRWAGVQLLNSHVLHQIDYCDLHAATYGIFCQGDSAALDSPMLMLTNSIIHNLSGDGLCLADCQTMVANTQISNTQGHVVSLLGGHHDFLHCTLAQFYAFQPRRGQALYIEGNTIPGLGNHFLSHAYFINSVITGYGDDVILGAIEESDDAPCDYLFHHCYLNTVESDDTLRFSHVVYDNKQQPTPQEKNFKRIDTDRFLYDFTPVERSSIRHIADSLYALPFDRLGRKRMDVGGMDAGCYQYEAPSDSTSSHQKSKRK